MGWTIIGASDIDRTLPQLESKAKGAEQEMNETVIRSSRGQIKVVSEDPEWKLNAQLIASLELALRDVDPGDTSNVTRHINGRLPTSHTVDRVIPELTDQQQAFTAYIRRKNGI